MDPWSVIELCIAAGFGALTSWLFSRRASKELKQEAESLRQLTITLVRILEGAGRIEVDEWDPKTGEPKSYPVMIRLKPLPLKAENPPPTAATQEDPPRRQRGEGDRAQ